MPPNCRTVNFAASPTLSADERFRLVCATASAEAIAAASRGDLLGRFVVYIGNHDMRAFTCQKQGHLAADSASTADDEHDLAAELRFRRHALQLGLFERPVLDAESFRTRQRYIVSVACEFLRRLRSPRLRVGVCRFTFFQRIRARHHVNRIDEKFGCDASFLLVLAETEKPQTRV